MTTYVFPTVTAIVTTVVMSLVVHRSRWWARRVQRAQDAYERRSAR